MVMHGQSMILALVLVTTLYVLQRLWPVIWRACSTSLKNIPGPPNPSWIFGSMRIIWDEDNSVPQERWAAQYGPNITYKGFFGIARLWTLDTRALNHILTHSNEYQKPSAARKNLAKILGEGVLITEGEQHRQQRRIMNPAFGPAQIRELTRIFVDKSVELRDVWAAQVDLSGSLPVRIDVLKDLNKMTLDVIGIAGFNYRFDALKATNKINELQEAFQEMFKPPTGGFTLLMLLKNIFPILNVIPDEGSKRVKRGQEAMHRVGTQLIQEKKAAIRRELAESKDGAVEKKDVHGRDLLTLLLKANMATDIPDSQRLSDTDVLAQVPTFLVAGHETTSTATTWCLYALTQAPHVQRELRAELLTLHTDSPTMDELNALPYLDAVVRETLRVHAPVPSTMRIAMKDDVIPVSRPFVDRYGKLQDSIKISKGSPILIPILALNRSKELWGEDAHDFKPERWANPPERVSSVPGVWAHLLSFLGGPRACIGYRFSLVEMKALLFVLIRAFEFELAVPPEDIMKKTAVVQRPLLRSAPERGNQLPLLVRRYTPIH
ncbi:cytochrome P450 [Trametes elegans]|nr:cytochrome P450 [Trametes elegans]